MVGGLDEGLAITIANRGCFLFLDERLAKLSGEGTVTPFLIFCRSSGYLHQSKRDGIFWRLLALEEGVSIASGVVFDRAGAAVEIKAHRHGAAKVKDEDDPID